LLSTAKLELQAAQGTNAYAFAKANLTAQSSLAAVAVGNYNKAVVASNAANAAAAASTSILAAASRAASGALALVGGPVGAAVLAGSAIAYYYATAETAAEKSAALTEEVDTLAQSFTGLTAVQRAVAVAKISTEMADVREKLISANDALNNWTETAKTDPFANQQVKNYKNQVETLNEELNTLSTKQQALFKSGLPTISKDPEKVQFSATGNTGDDKKAAADAKKLAAQKADAEEYLERLRQSNLSEKEMIEVQQRDKAQILADFYTKGLIDVQRYQDGLTSIIGNSEKERIELESKSEAERQALVNSVDPIQKLRSERDARIAVINEYDAIEGSNHILSLEAKAAADSIYNEGVLIAQEERFRSMSDSNAFLLDSLDSLESAGSQAIAGIITQTTSAEDAMRMLGRAIIGQGVSALVEMGAQYLKNMIIGQTASAATAATAAATGTAMAASYAPAAALASLASFGGNSIPATAGIVSTMATSQSLAILGAREQGGSMVGGGAYQMAERGKAEVIMPAGASRARTAAQMRDIMGQNGGGASNVTIVNNTTGRVDNVQTEQRDDGMLMITIEENIINQMLDPDSRMSKARRSTANQAGF
jgi:hypothetical protein